MFPATDQNNFNRQAKNYLNTFFDDFIFVQVCQAGSVSLVKMMMLKMMNPFGSLPVSDRTFLNLCFYPWLVLFSVSSWGGGRRG